MPDIPEGGWLLTNIRFFYPAVTTEGPTHGGVSTTNQISGSKNNVWDDVKGSEAVYGKTEYRKIFVGLDPSGTGIGGSCLSNTVVWIATQTPGNDEIYLQANTIPGNVGNVMTAVTDLTFSNTNVSEETGVQLGLVTTNTAIGLWLRRVVNPSCSSYIDNTLVLEADGDADVVPENM